MYVKNITAMVAISGIFLIILYSLPSNGQNQSYPPQWFVNDLRYHQQHAVQVETQLYQNKKRNKYKTGANLYSAWYYGQLVPISSMPNIGLIVNISLSPYKDQYGKYYQTLDPALWNTVRLIARSWKNKGGNPCILYSAVRTKAFEASYGENSKSHCLGKAVDIWMPGGKRVWQWKDAYAFITFLRANTARFQYDFYTEKPDRDHIHLFSTHQ